jgi:predicted nucleotidyltransferase
MSQILDELRIKILPVLQHHDVIHAAIFGSFARGEEREDSDLDILVELKKGKSLLDLVALKLELEEVLKREIDVVTYNSLHKRIRERVLEEQMPII